MQSRRHLLIVLPGLAAVALTAAITPASAKSADSTTPSHASAVHHPAVRPGQQRGEKYKGTMKLKKRRLNSAQSSVMPTVRSTGTHARLTPAPYVTPMLGCQFGSPPPCPQPPPKNAKPVPATDCHGSGKGLTCCWDYNTTATAFGVFLQALASYRLEDFFCATRYAIASHDVTVHPSINFAAGLEGWVYDGEVPESRDVRYYWATPKGSHTGLYVASTGNFQTCIVGTGGGCWQQWLPTDKQWVWSLGKAGKQFAPHAKDLVSD